MTTVRGPEKGRAEQLVISEDANQRFFVGLGWDPKDPPDSSVRLPKKPKGGARNSAAFQTRGGVMTTPWPAPVSPRPSVD